MLNVWLYPTWTPFLTVTGDLESPRQLNSYEGIAMTLRDYLTFITSKYTKVLRTSPV